MESTFMDDAVVYFQDIAIISSADVFFFFLIVWTFIMT